MSTPLKLVAFDLDGTLTQHKTPIEPQNRAVLEALSQRYHLLMVGAGNAQRIFHQLGDFPIDVIGNYGMQHGSYDPKSRSLRVENAAPVPCDREDILARAGGARYRCGFTHYMAACGVSSTPRADLCPAGHGGRPRRTSWPLHRHRPDAGRSLSR